MMQHELHAAGGSGSCHRGTEGVLPLGVRRRAEAIGGSHRGSAATESTSYGAYDIGRVLPPGEHHRRKPQGATTGGGSY